MSETDSRHAPGRQGYVRLAPAVAALALVSLVACAPAREDVVGRYELQGDPQKVGLAWTLHPDGSFTAESAGTPSAGVVKGTWTYHRGWVPSNGRLLITTEFLSREYEVTELPGVALAIVVDSDKGVAFHKVSPPASGRK